MFSDQFYEKRLSFRERNMKLLQETVTYIRVTYNGNSHGHNALQKIPLA